MRTSLRNSHAISAHCLAPDDQGWRGVQPHGDGRRPRALIAAVASLVTLFMANTATPASDAFLEFVVAVEETKGHLVVSQELYGASQRGRAALHAAHPVQEIGNRLVGPVKRVDPALAKRVQAAMKGPGREIEDRVSAARYEATVARTFALLDTAIEAVVPEPQRADLGFRARVLAKLMRSLVTEYEEGVKDGRVTQLVEYQDAYGFFKRAESLMRALAPVARAKNAPATQQLEDEMTTLARTFSSPDGPKVALTVAELTRHVDAIVTALGALGA